MDFSQLKASDTNNSETIAFRISPKEKEALLDACYTHKLALGKVMRALVKEFLEEMDNNANIQRN